MPWDEKIVKKLNVGYDPDHERFVFPIMRNKKYNEKARDYRDQFFEGLCLDSNQKYFQALKSQFDKHKHYLSVSFNFKLPKDQLLTKQGYLSRKSMDADNLLKLPCDFLTAKKYSIENGYPCNNLMLDDQFFGTIQVTKSESPDQNYYIFIKIEVLPLSDLLLT